MANQIFKEFESQERRIQRQGLQKEQSLKEAIQRKLAAGGMLQSGQAIKLESEGIGEVQKQTQEALDALRFQKAGISSQLEESQKQREFASSEAQKQRSFLSEQSKIDRDFQNKQFEWQKELGAASLALQKDSLDLEKDAIAFNKTIAQWEMGQPTDIFSQLLPSSINPFSKGFGKGILNPKIIPRKPLPARMLKKLKF